jgi:hypothetical protein
MRCKYPRKNIESDPGGWTFTSRMAQTNPQISESLSSDGKSMGPMNFFVVFMLTYI